MISTDYPKIQQPRSGAINVFIIAAAKDRGMEVQIRDKLVRQGMQSWERPADLGEKELQHRVPAEIEKADVVLYLLSHEVWESDTCQEELTCALAEDKHVIPLLIEPSPLKDILSSVFPMPVIDLTPGGDGIEKLIRQIKQVTRPQAIAVPPPPPQPVVPPPYKRQIGSWPALIAAILMGVIGFSAGMLVQMSQLKASRDFQAIAAMQASRANSQAVIARDNAIKADKAAAIARQNQQKAQKQAALALQNQQKAEKQAAEATATAESARKAERDAKTNLSIVLKREKAALKAEKDAKTNLSIVLKREKDALARAKAATEEADMARWNAVVLESELKTSQSLLNACEAGGIIP